MGDDQVRRYITKLEDGITRLSTAQGPFKDVSELYPGLRMAGCEHHYVFCLPRKDAPALIVAIERMDVIARLASRLRLRF